MNMPQPMPQDPQGASSGEELAGLLTESEREVIRQAGLMFQLITNDIVSDGPTRDADLTELTTAIHIIQRTIMAQAAGRAYPGKYRLLGTVIPTFDKDGNPLSPPLKRQNPPAEAQQ